MLKNVSQIETHFLPKLKSEVVVDLGLIKVMDRKRCVVKRGKEITANIANLCGVLAQAVKHIL